MEENEKLTLDWVHLPAGVEAVSLWAALHDARLYFVASDRLARTATLKFEIFYLGDEGGSITFQLEDVTSLRAIRAVIWPGEFVLPKGISQSEGSRLIAEYQAKWREESLSWSELEAMLGANNLNASEDDKDYLDVSVAYAVRNGLGMTLHIQGHLLSADLWHELYLRGSHITLFRSNGESLGMEQLVALGEAWWDDFGREKTD